MRIGDVTIGRDQRPFIIAELSGNHGGSLDTALAIVDAVATTGAQALKIQTYTADTMTLDLADGDFVISNPASPWVGRGLYELYEEAHTPWEWHAPIFERARSHGMLAFSSPFDASAIDFLEDLDVPAYKIASFENTDLPLIRGAAATGKPLIISTGLASLTEIGMAVQAARDAGCKDLALLKCTSDYPADPRDSNLRTIPHLRESFGCEVGLSDHTLGIGAAIASVALGATIVEKHVTLRRSDGAVDSGFSLEPDELQSMVEETGRAALSLGSVRYGPTDHELPSLAHRRSLYVVRDMQAGEALNMENVRAIRPGHGASPARLDDFLGRRVRTAVSMGTPLTANLVE